MGRGMVTKPNRWAALDVGTNTTMLLVAHMDDGLIVEDEEWYQATRLGEGVDRTRSLDPNAMKRTLDAAADMLEDARRRYPDVVGTAVATSAVREAENGQQFLDRCSDRLGVRPRVLTGEQEAQYLFRGVTSDREPTESIIHIDIGGGSTELTAGRRGLCAFARSVNIGCVRLGERFGLFEAVDARTRAAARRAVTEALHPSITCLSASVAFDLSRARVFATGGSATTFASLVLALGAYDRGRVHGFVGERRRLRVEADRLAGLPTSLRRRIPGVFPDRAAVLPGGLMILGIFLSLLGHEGFTVSTRGLRAGLIDAMAGGALPIAWPG